MSKKILFNRPEELEARLKTTAADAAQKLYYTNKAIEMMAEGQTNETVIRYLLDTGKFNFTDLEEFIRKPYGPRFHLDYFRFALPKKIQMLNEALELLHKYGQTDQTLNFLHQKFPGQFQLN